jgi:hypothetical protein
VPFQPWCAIFSVVRIALILPLLACLTCPAVAQETSGATANPYPYLLRISRVIPHLDSCVLLRRDGGYHLERDHDDSTDVYEGELSAEELSKIQTWLDDEQLQKLTRDQIVTPLVSQAEDEVQINIFRGDHWQDLLFLSSESRAPFHALAPLLEWFNGLRNAPHRTISEDVGRNNCMTPGKVAFSTRPSTSFPDAKITPAKPAGQNPEAPEQTIAKAAGGQPVPPLATDSYLIRWLHESFDRSGVDSTCAIVYASGLYHVEHSSQAFGGKVRAKIYQSTIDGPQKRELQELLTETNLKAVEKGNLPDEFFEKLQPGHTSMDIRFLLSEATFVWIPRERAVQNLAFASDLRVQSALGNHYYTSDKSAKYVRPLEKWVKTALRTDKNSLVEGVTASFCAPK